MGAGRLLTFEGIDGSGKSTQAARLADALRAAGRAVVLTREPGGSPGAEAVRQLLVEGQPGRWSAVTEILLFTAARRDHWERTIAPALARGDTVICDRFVDSTRVYQAAADPALRGVVDQLHALVLGREADRTFVLDVEPAAAALRARGRGIAPDRFEARGPDFQARLRAGFLALARASPQRVRVVDGDRKPATVAAEIRALAGEVVA